MQRFCESFFNLKPRSLKNLTHRASFNLNEDLMEMVLIPALQIHKAKKTVKTIEKTEKTETEVRRKSGESE